MLITTLRDARASGRAARPQRRTNRHSTAARAMKALNRAHPTSIYSIHDRLPVLHKCVIV